ERQLERECRAAPRVGLDADAAAYAAHDLARDVEPEAGAADTAREVRVEAEELLEDPLVLRRGDADAAGAHDAADAAIGRLELELDETAVRGVLDGVLDQVDEHLTQPVRVGGHLRAWIRQAQRTLHPRRQVRLRGGQHRTGQLTGVRAADLDGGGAG